MENFITGFPANENAFRQVVYRALGKEKADFFFDRYLEYFFTEEDARFIRSLGLNLVRLPFNYRHFEDDMNPTVIRESGLKHLDRVIKICADHEIYTILDLHAAPGYQNQDWHSDNPSQQAFFWQHKHFQDRAVWLWEIIADRYKDNPWVAGYNPLNEPSDPTGECIRPFLSTGCGRDPQDRPGAHHFPGREPLLPGFLRARSTLAECRVHPAQLCRPGFYRRRRLSGHFAGRVFR